MAMNTNQKGLIVGLGVLAVVVVGIPVYNSVKGQGAPVVPTSVTAGGTTIGCSLASGAAGKIVSELRAHQSYDTIIAGAVAGYALNEACKRVIKTWTSDPTASTTITVSGRYYPGVTGGALTLPDIPHQTDLSVFLKRITDCSNTYGSGTQQSKACVSGYINP